MPDPRPVDPDQMCIKIRRFGALGDEELSGRLNLHQVDRDAVETWLRVTLDSLCPGDRAEITIWRGHQGDVPMGSFYEDLATPVARSDFDPLGPGPFTDHHHEF